MLTDISTRLRDNDLADIKDEVTASSPEQLAEQLPYLAAPVQAIVFRLLDKTSALYVFELLDRDEQGALVEALGTAETIDILERLDADDRVHLLDELPAKVAKRLVAQLDPATRSSVGTMLNYAPGTVGRMLSPTYVAVRRSATAGEAIDAVRRSDARSEHLSTVFVVDEGRRYEGLIRLADLLRADDRASVALLVEATNECVEATDSAADAARRLQRRDLDALPVVDSERRLIGAVTVDDAMDALDADTTATMFAKAGIADPGHSLEVLRSERLTSGSIRYPVRVRLSFLLVTLAGGLAVGGLIESFEDTLAAVVALAIFVPLVMDMGGNVGTQSTTIFARGLALGHIDLSRIGLHLRREARVGLVMGTIIGLLGGTIAYLWQGAPNDIPELGIAVGVALFTSVNLACFLGFAMPWAMVKIGLDHAPGADPFITTIKDFTGLFVYFGMAAWVLQLT